MTEQLEMYIVAGLVEAVYLPMRDGGTIVLHQNDGDSGTAVWHSDRSWSRRYFATPDMAIVVIAGTPRVVRFDPPFRSSGVGMGNDIRLDLSRAEFVDA